MKKLTKKFQVAFLAAWTMLLMPYFACAQDCDPYTFNLCKLRGIEIYGDFLYWKPCVDDMDYVAELTKIDTVAPGSSYSQEIEYHKLGLDWKPGFRIGAAINDVWCEWRFNGSYTNVKTNDTSEFKAERGAIAISPFQFAALTNPSYDGVSSSGGFYKIKGKIEIDYQNWDLLMSRIICSTDCYTIAPFVGAEGLLLKQKIKTRSHLHSIRDGTVIDTPGGFGNGRAQTNWKSDFHAYGIKFGTDYIYQLGDCFQFFTRGSFTIAAGENSGKNHQSLTRNSEDGMEGLQAVDVIREKENESSIMINGYNIQLGFIYETETCGYDVAFRAGYEFVKWHNVPKPRRFPGGDNENDNAYNRAISTSPSKSTIGFHGLMAGACLTF